MTGPGKYRAIVEMKVGPIRSRFNFDIETIEERPPEFAAFRTTGEEGGRASQITAQSTLSLRPLDKGSTEVSYASSLTVVGRFGKFAGGVLNKIAESKSDEFVATFVKRMEIPLEVTSEAVTDAVAERGSLAAVWAWFVGLARRIRLALGLGRPRGDGAAD